MASRPEIARRFFGGRWRTDVENEGGTNGGSVPGTVQIEQFPFNETAGAGTYTATFELPADSYVIGFVSKTLVGWDADDAMITSIGDSDAVDSWSAIGADPDIKPVDQGWVVSDLNNTRGWFDNDSLGFYPTGTTITIVVTTLGTGGTSGRTRIAMFYATGIPSTAAVKS